MSLSSPIGTLVRFGRELRRAGLGVSLGQLESCIRAFEWLDPLARADVFHAVQATLLTRQEDRALFRRVFDAFWDGMDPALEQRLPLAPRHRPLERAPLAVLLAERAGLGDPEVDVRDRSRTASENELLARKDFSVLSAAELEALRRAIAERRWPFALRVTRRKRPARRGPELDLRRVAARAARSGGALLELPRRVAKIKRRPIVILADVSGSMELYTRVLLSFFHALSKELVDVESFVFATRLTHITHELTLRHVDRALERVAQGVVDFSSGTRIGESLHTFNVRWADRVLRRGAVVLIVSDGWECGSVEALQTEMRVLRERCQRLIWLNPLLGQSQYAPSVAGMAAALPFVDDFLACHDLQSLSALSEHLAALPRGRGRARAWVRSPHPGSLKPGLQKQGAQKQGPLQHGSLNLPVNESGIPS